MGLFTKIIVALIVVYLVVNYVYDNHPETYEKLEKSFPIVEKFINLKDKIKGIGPDIDIEVNVNVNNQSSSQTKSTVSY